MKGVDGGVWEYGDNSFPKAARTYFAGTFCKHPLVRQLGSNGSPASAGIEREVPKLIIAASLPPFAVRSHTFLRTPLRQVQGS